MPPNDLGPQIPNRSERLALIGQSGTIAIDVRISDDATDRTGVSFYIPGSGAKFAPGMIEYASTQIMN